MRESWNITVDTRERVPLIFPSHLVTSSGLSPTTVPLTTSRGTLPYGDYLLSSHPTSCIIERKGSIHEVTSNLLKKDRRACFLRECASLQSKCSFPILLFEGDPYSLLTQRGPHQEHPSYVLSLLFDLLLHHRITPLFLRSDSIPARRSVGEVAALLLTRSALLTSQGGPSDPSALPCADPIPGVQSLP